MARTAWLVACMGLLGWGPAGADPVWQTPVNLGSTLNTPYNDWYPVLARDGSFMIFVSDRPGGHGSSDIYITHSEGGAWQSPQNLGPQVNTAYGESAPFLAAGDSVLYFMSLMPGGLGGGDVYRCSLASGVPGPRENVGPPINGPSLDCCPLISRDGNSFFICSDRAGGYGQMDVWAFQRVGGAWGGAVNLGSQVNTPQTDCPRWISDDGRVLLICSTRTDGHGLADMWISTETAGQWSAPINMGDPLNTAAHEWGAWFHGSQGTVGGTIFFGSGRAGGLGGWDLWQSDAQTSAAPEPHGLLPDARGEDLLALQACPNPCRGATTLTYRLPVPAPVWIGIFDAQGRLMTVLVDESQQAGDHRANVRTTEALPSASAGVCYCKMRAGDRETTHKVTVLTAP